MIATLPRSVEKGFQPALGIEMESQHERFFVYLKAQLDCIELIELDNLKIHKKILYVSFIDAIAGLVYPTYSNRERFIELIRNFGSWRHSDKVSVPHLMRALRLNPDPSYNKIRALVTDSLSKWREGDQISLEHDLDSVKVGTHWPSGKKYEQPVEGATWMHLKHVELLYAYRNALVHEFRSLGMDLESSGEDTEPYYLTNYEITNGGTRCESVHWELIYPSLFLKNLANNIFESVRNHIGQSNIDLIDVVQRGKYWVKELNR